MEAQGVADLIDGLNSFAGGSVDGDILTGGLEDSPFLVNCDACKQPFSEPVILSCLHVIDKSCLRLFQVNVDSDFPSTQCPTCKEQSEPLDQLRVVKSLISKPDECDDDEEDAIAKCTLCTESNEGISKCYECSAVLCQTCVDTHKRMKMFSNHTVIVLLAEEQMHFKKLLKSIEEQKPVNCDKHKRMTLSLFCHQCYIPICQDCASVDHLLHTVESLDRESVALQNDISLHLEKNRQERVANSHRSEKLYTNLCDISAVQDYNKDRIEETFDYWLSALSQVKESFIQKNSEVNVKLESIVQQYISDVEKVQSYMKYVTTFTQFCLDKMSSMDFLFSAKSIMIALNNAYSMFEKLNDLHDGTLQSGVRFSNDRLKMKEVVFQNFGSFVLPDVESGVPGSGAANFLGTYDSSTKFSGNVDNLYEVGNGSLPSFFNQSYPSGVVPPGSNRSFSPCGTTVDLPLATMLNFDHALQATEEGYSVFNRTNMGAVLDSHDLNTENTIHNGDVFPQCMNDMVHSNSSDRATPSSAFYGTYADGAPLNIPNADFGTVNGVGYNPLTNPPFPNRQGRCSIMSVKTRWGSLGAAPDQVNAPHGFCLGFKEEIVVADTNNHRIMIFDKFGVYMSSFGVAGREEGQLWFPRKVAIIRHSGKFVVCDRGTERSRMQIFTASGHFIRKISIRYIDIVAGITMNSSGNIVAVDSVSPSVFVIKESGDLERWFDCTEYMREPSDIVYNNGLYYICDFKGHCVSVFNEWGVYQLRIGSDSITNFPNGIDVSDHGDVLVGDSHGNRLHVAIFDRNGAVRGEFECPNVKVSRCCGLKITSEGLLVTLAKNNNQVLVIDTLYVN